MSDSPTPRRRWYQFSLKTMLLVMFVLCLGFGWVGYRMQQARNDQRVLAKLREFGPLSAAYNSWGRVESLHLSNTEVTDAELAQLKGLTNLRSLSLHGTNITDAGLEHLRGLPNLEWLKLGNTEVTDDG